MNKRIKKKYKVDKVYWYRDQRIWLNHAYAYNHTPRRNSKNNPSRVMLLYGYDGNEVYFNNVSAARKYIDQNYNKYNNDYYFRV